MRFHSVEKEEILSDSRCGRYDPAIKLFGRTVALPDGVAASENSDLAPMDETSEVEDTCGETTIEEVKDQAQEDLENSVCNETDVSSNLNDDCIADNQACSVDNKAMAETKSEQPEQKHVEVDTSSKGKVLKKPDKILPCPRCNSMDTKFCYFNNYNVNQPRHFCKNCQRYWTAGGTMRNIPVGAGRRKSKHSLSHYRHLVVSSDGMQSPRIENPDSCHGKLFPRGHSSPTAPFAGNRTVLKFGQEAPLCESMVNTLSIADQKRNTETCPVICDDNVKEPSYVSTMTASDCMENEKSEKVARLDQTVVPAPCNGLTPVNPLQCYPGPPWAYPWGPGWNNITAIASGQCTSEVACEQENGGPKLIPWSPPPLMTAPAFVAPPPVPYPFMPPSFWGCMVTWPSGTLNAPWSGANGNLSPSLSVSNSGSLGDNSPTLGKHLRDTGSRVVDKTEKSLWIPKTLRIDDPDEAAKSSIWATLGIKPDRNEPIAKGGIFRSFQPRTEDCGNKSDVAQVLHANPAALSRSSTFQEST